MTLVLAGGTLLLLARLAAAICLDHAAVESLDFERFTGVWNIIKEADNHHAEALRNEKCKHTVFSIPKPNTGYDIQANIVIYNLTSRTYNETRLGLRKMKNNHQDGKFEIFGSEFHGSRYFIVSTDYDNYAVVWLCYNGINDGEDTEYSAILSRKKSLAEHFVNEAKMHLPRRAHRIIDQTFCPEYESSHP